MSKVKLFDLNRLARFKDAFTGEDSYFVPGDLCAVTVDRDKLWVYLPNGLELSVKVPLEEFEAEINRALAATSTAAHEYADESAKEIADKLIQLKATIKDADMMANNDFYPDLDKDKKGYN